MDDVTAFLSSTWERLMRSGSTEDQEETTALIAYSSQAAPSTSSLTIPDANPMVNLDGAEGSTSYKKRRIVSRLARRIEDVQAKLPPGCPSCVKSVNVTGLYKLALPSYFSKDHLPKEDTIFTLIDEENTEYSMKYKASKCELIGGWKSFSREHGLVEGDALVFCLTRPTTFQVYIVRCNRIGRSRVIKKAMEIQMGLDPKFCSLVKSLHPSHVTGEFRLGLPSVFCIDHLPKQTVMIKLIDEEMKEYAAQYMPCKFSLTVGWKNFCLSHKLVEGDALILELIEPTTFQVYITRASAVAENEGFNGSVAENEGFNGCNCTKVNEIPAENHQMTLALVSLQQQEGETSISGSEKVNSGVFDGIILGSRVGFTDMKSLESFTDIINGTLKDSKLSKQEMVKYYDLCRSQKSFLHDDLLKTLNPKCSSGIISQTINIAEKIKASMPNTTPDDLAEWDKTLQAFEQLGMNVGFLRAQIRNLSFSL